MKVSYNWLTHYLKIPVDLNSTSDILTSIGLEVEGLQEIFTHFDHLVVGKVVECYQHPNADRLKITKVDVGTEMKQIVCGANNVKKNQLVVVVLPGNSLTSQDGSTFKIKKTKIRGEVSEGMICAEDELGLGDSHTGIIEITKDVEIGSRASDYFNISKDYIFEIGLTPNRTDAFSHIGVCKDLRAYFMHHGHNLELNLPSIEAYQNESDLSLNLSVDAENLCHKYLGVCLENVIVKDSPQWLKNKLISIGLKPINNVVDVTNFVLHETGNPLHAFDYDKISNSKIIVRQANEGEEFETLDKKSIKLNSKDLVISDNKKALCLAGVMGSLNCEINHDTNNVFLESAFFSPTSVRQTSKLHGINSDSSYRFERGVDFQNCEYALRRAALLIKEITDCSIGQEIGFTSPDLIEREVDFYFDYCHKTLGFEIPSKTIMDILVSLSFKVNSVNENMCKLTIPSFRADVYRQIDVVEEILRIYGYNNFPAAKYIKFQPLFDLELNQYELKNIISQILVADGFFETKNNSLVQAKKSNLFDHKIEGDMVKLINPLSQDLGIMRTNMFVSGLETIKYNLNRQLDDLKIFEFGKTYSLAKNSYIENQKLTIFSCGKFKGNNWGDKARESDFFLMKGVLNKILDRFFVRLSDFSLEELNTEYSAFGLLYYLVNNKEEYLYKNRVFEIGLFSQEVLKKIGIKKSVYYVDVNLDRLFDLINLNNSKYKAVSKFPHVTRDLSLLVPESVSYLELENAIHKVSTHILKEVSLFDLYQGEGVEKRHKSYAISFLFINQSGTLKDMDVDREMLNIFNYLQSEYKVSLRDGELKAN